jgi:adenylate cyclase
MFDQNRQLAAILFTDIVGYTHAMQQNEGNAVNIMKRYVTVLHQEVINYSGKILNDYGDGSLCTFPSMTQAMRCAISLQHQFQIDPKVPLRVGLHVGEIFFEGQKVMGDSVNVASRIQSLGIANVILFSKEVFDKIKNQPEFKSVSLGLFEFKNIDDPVEVFALANSGLVIPKRAQLGGKLKGRYEKSITKKWLLTIVAASLLVAGVFLYKEVFHRPEFTGSEKSIAVLPFENIGSDDSQEYITDGITQDIINNLSKISSLQKVIGWISVKRFKKTTKSLQEIADELGVAAILSGTIQKQAQKTRIIAELTEVSTNKRLWGDDFEYSGSDLLSIQSKVAVKIANALQANLTPEEKKNIAKHYTENVEAYKLYRKGRFFWDQRTKVSYDSAEAYYKKAIELDPDYALAYAGIADCYTFNQKGLSQVEAIPIARSYASKALSLDSTLTEAWTTIAFIQSHFDYEWKNSAERFRKIISNDPNYAVAHLYYGNVLIYEGQIDSGLNETKRALSLDPLSAVINYVLGRNYYYSRKYDSSIMQFKKATILNPKFIYNFVPMGQAFVQKKDYTKAIEAFSKIPAAPFDQGNNGLLMQSYTYAFAGDFARSRQLLAKVQLSDRIKCPYFMAYVYVGLHEVDSAMSQLEYAYESHSIIIVYMKLDPVFDSIRNEPRFIALLKKLGLE